jgi:hypothetical protein
MAPRLQLTTSGRLDVSVLAEESAIADFRCAEPMPTLRELVRAPSFEAWSLAPGPVLIGRDEVGAVRCLDVHAIDMDLHWAVTDLGMIRLGERSPLPIGTGRYPNQATT